MATVINNPPERERVVERSDGAGWAVAVIILLVAVAVGVWAYTRYYRAGGYEAPAPTNSGTNINVTLPGDSQPQTPSGGSNSGSVNSGTGY